jgi:hypothetical protein
MQSTDESVKLGGGGSVSLMLTPLELIEPLTALIPPPRLQAAEPPEAAIHWSGARGLLWVGSAGSVLSEAGIRIGHTDPPSMGCDGP